MRTAFVLLLLGTVLGAQSPMIEQAIGGVSVGNTVADALRHYPSLRWSGHGVSIAPIGGACELELVGSKRDDPSGHVEVLTLKRKEDAVTGNDPACDVIRTGAGLRFGGDVAEIERTYPEIHLMEPDKDPELYRRDSDDACLSRRSDVLRSMFIYWSKKHLRIEKISVDASRMACLEYRDSEHDQ